MKKLQLGRKNPSPPMIDYSAMDPECVEMVQYFNSHGLYTEMSCQGHERVNQSIFWVSFVRETTEDDIIKFQSLHLDERGNFCACGHFGRRVILYNDPVKGSMQISECWEYVAGNYNAAHEDLRQWKLKGPDGKRGNK